MRIRVAFLTAAAVVVSLAATSPDTREITDPKKIASADMPGAGQVPIDDLFFTRSTGGGAWSPDGKEVVFTSNFTGRLNLWKVNSSGGWPIQLSQSDDRQGNAIWSPDGKWILYQSDRGGLEHFDIFAIPGNGGESINLTKTDDISETSPVWSHDGAQLAIAYKPNPSPATDVAILDWKTRAMRNLTNEKTPNHLWTGHLWSPDGKFLYASRVIAGFTDTVFTVSKPPPANRKSSRRTKASRALWFPPSHPTAKRFWSLRTSPAATRTLRSSTWPQRNSPG